jgi:prenyltransferase beta subunit
MWTRRQFLSRSTALLALGGGVALSGENRDALPDGSAAKGMITPAAQEAIDQGLAFLQHYQRSDGAFGTGTHEGNVAITSLAALAMMSGGHQPGRGHYGKVVSRALDFVMQQEDPQIRGFLSNSNASSHGPMYGHGFGTLFLAEVSGMVQNKQQRKRLRETLQRAVDLIISSQNEKGAWRYKPDTHEADISVTICQIMALRAARNAGFSVPKSTVDRCTKYVKRCQDPNGEFRYMDVGGRGPGPAFARTAAGVVALYSAGIYKGPEVEKGLDYLMQFKPNQAFARHDMHYFYGHYYAAQAMWTAGGMRWAEWYPAIRDELLNRSRLRVDGSWSDQICSHYGTAMACIILQIPNNYLPILQK